MQRNRNGKFSKAVFKNCNAGEDTNLCNTKNTLSYLKKNLFLLHRVNPLYLINRLTEETDMSRPGIEHRSPRQD
jgi:hypothetical protein